MMSLVRAQQGEPKSDHIKWSDFLFTTVASSYITVSNEENAIAKVIEDIENGRIVI